MFWQAVPGLVVSRTALDAAASAPFSLTATANATDVTTQTTYTFASQNLGTAHSSRVIAVCILTRNSGGTQIVSSATFNGVSATAGPGISNSAATRAEIWYANVPSGTTGDIVITFAGANQRCGIQVYSIISPSTTAPSVTATSTVNTTVTSGSITIPTGGAAIMCGFSLTGGPGTPTGSPTGFDNLDLNSNIIGTQQMWAIHSNAGAVTGVQTLTSTLTGSSSNSAAFAVWGP